MEGGSANWAATHMDPPCFSSTLFKGSMNLSLSTFLKYVFWKYIFQRNWHYTPTASTACTYTPTASSTAIALKYSMYLYHLCPLQPWGDKYVHVLATGMAVDKDKGDK